MRTRSSRTNNGYIGGSNLNNTNGGIVSENKNYLTAAKPSLNSTPWTRPSNWLSLPSMTAGDQMVAGLLAVYPGDPALTGSTASGNYVAFSVGGCPFTVDWGNNSVQSFADGAQAQYNFDYGSLPANTTITGDAGLSGYRQTVIKIYPTTTGTTFTSVYLNRSPSVTTYAYWNPGWLDIKVAGSSINSFTMSRSSSSSALREMRQF